MVVQGKGGCMSCMCVHMSCMCVHNVCTGVSVCVEVYVNVCACVLWYTVKM